jgi:hypothetical protein
VRGCEQQQQPAVMVVTAVVVVAVCLGKIKRLIIMKTQTQIFHHTKKI